MEINYKSEFSGRLLEFIPVFHRKLLKPLDTYFRDKISPSQFTCLRILNARGPLTMKELACIMVTTKQQMSAIVGKLYEEGFVERTGGENDKRTIRISLKKAAYDFLIDYEIESKKKIEIMLENYSEEEAEKLSDSIALLTDFLSKI